MAKKNLGSFFDEQKKNKPLPRSLIEQLSNEAWREVGLDFLEYLAGLRTNPSWYATNSYSVSFKGKRVCLIRIDPPSYPRGDRLLIHINDFEKQTIEAHLAEITEEEKRHYFDGIRHCGRCADCAPGVTLMIGGVAMDEMCGRHPERLHFSYRNPTAEQLCAIKELIALRRQSIMDGLA